MKSLIREICRSSRDIPGFVSVCFFSPLGMSEFLVYASQNVNTLKNKMAAALLKKDDVLS